MYTCSICVQCAKWADCAEQECLIRCNDSRKCEDCPVDCECFELDPIWDLVDDDVPF